jgi:predicted membrane chloride channel (bestrophin family)
MITYETRAGFVGFGSIWTLLATFRDGAYRGGVAVGLFAGVACYVLATRDLPRLERFNPGEELWPKVTVLLCFLLVFHTRAAIERFESGAKMLESMSNEYLSAASFIVSLSRITKEAQQVAIFRQTVARLFSLLNLLCYCEVSGEEDEEVLGSCCGVDLEEDLVDVRGLDEDSLEHIRSSECKVEIVFQKITNLITDNFKNGALQVSPPLLTRAFQHMGTGMKHFDKAMNLAGVQVPFPYLIVTEATMLGHLFITPFQMTFWCKGPYGASGWTFFLTFVIWSLYGVAAELDRPFGRSVVAFDLVKMQKGFNLRVVSLLHYGWSVPPRKGAAAVEDTTLLLSYHESVGCVNGPGLTFTPRALGRPSMQTE